MECCCCSLVHPPTHPPTHPQGLSKVPGLVIKSDEISPLIHVGVDGGKYGWDLNEQQTRLREVARRCVDAGYAVVTSKHTILNEELAPPPTLRLAVSAVLTEAELKGAVETIKTVFGNVSRK